MAVAPGTVTVKLQGPVTPGVLPTGQPRSAFRLGLEVFLENKLAVTGVGIIVFMLAFCFIGGNIRAVLRHIAPNAVGTIMVTATFQIADAIALVVALSYLGLGIRPPGIDWGTMLSVGISYVYDGYWWLIIPAGFCIVLVISASIFIGEGLRDAVEVRLQRR